MHTTVQHQDTNISTAGTEQRIAGVKKQQALLKTGALQNAILDSANFLIIATDTEGVIQIFNAGAERMLGYTAATVLNRISPADIADQQQVIARAKALSNKFDTPITSGFEALVFNAMRGVEDTFDLNYIRKDGSRFPALVSVTALRDSQDNITGYLLHGTDNTTRKQAEAELALLYEAQHNIDTELKSSMQSAENASIAKSEFLSSMCHELLIPLNAILEFIQPLESASSPPPATVLNSGITRINQAASHQLSLINDILSLATAESAGVALAQEAVSLHEVMHECQNMLQPQAQQRGIKLILPQYDMRHFAYADRSRIKQVLLSLVSNAIQYNRAQGSVELECTESPPGRIRVSIRDTGTGLYPKQVSQLFHAFNRIRQEADNVEKISLVVAKHLIELMGGTIGVKSAVGEGCEFWLELKAAADPQLCATVGEVTGLFQSHMRRGAGPHTLLYVEDNTANMKMVEQLISRQPDIRLLTAENGSSGIEIARILKPDVILMDINLPDMSGFKALAVLRADPSTAHIPVIALTANALPININSGLQAGFFRYLTKPIKLSELMYALDIALEFAQQNPARHANVGATS